MKIGLIEDDLLLGRALVNCLQDAGHDALWVRLAGHADPLLDDSSFDAVLLDMNLPDGDGLALLTRARAAGKTVPILIITARDQLEQRLSGLDAGADDYLVKPFENAELLARIRAVLRRHGPWSGQGAQLRIGDICLDEQRMLVTRGKRVLTLSPTEFGLLRELMRAANRVRTRRQLEAQTLIAAEGQSLDTHMSNLRRKVGAGLIRTVRGVGYIIDKP